MAREAERLLEGTGWLPEPLRVDGSETAAAADQSGDAAAGALPDFLAGEDGEPSDEDLSLRPADDLQAAE